MTKKTKAKKARRASLGVQGIRRLARRAGSTAEKRNVVVAVRAGAKELITQIVHYQASLLSLNTREDPVTRRLMPTRKTVNEQMVRRSFAEVCPGITVLAGEA